MVLAFVLSVGVLSADAAYMHSVTLMQGSSGAQVASLQATLGVSADGSFGPITKAAVVAFQLANGLVADGVVGPMTGAVLSGVPSSGNYPAGCSSYSGYSVTTGQSCAVAPASYPPGCSSNSGYSVTTGQSCAASTGTYPAGCSSTVGYSPTTGAKCDGGSVASGPLAGGAGSITVSGLSTYASEEVGEDEEDVKVVAFEIEADDESDVEIGSIKVELNQSTAADSDNLDDYAASISVWMGDDKVGEADADDFSDSATTDVWVKTISLDNSIVRAGETEKFYLAVTALSGLDSGDIDTDDWQIGLSSVRFTDGEGVTTTEAVTLDIDDDVVDDEVEQDFDFAAFATAADTNFKVTKTSGSTADAINDAHTIDVDDTEDTDGVEVLAFSVEIEGDSDVTLDALPVEFTMTATTITNLDDSDIKGFHLLMKNGSTWEEVGTADLADCATDADCDTVGLTEDYLFDNMGLTLEAGDKYDFRVEVDMPGLDEDFDAGDTILGTLDDDQMDQAEFDAEDESGESLADGDTNGSAVSEASEIRDTGILVSNFESSYVKTASDTTGINETVEFTLKFDVEAFGENAYVDETCGFDDDGTYVTTQTSVSLDNDADGDNTTCTSFTSEATDAGSGFEVLDGEIEHFVVTILGNGGEAGVAGTSVTFQARINNIGYNMGADGAGDISYSLNLDEYESASVTVFDR